MTILSKTLAAVEPSQVAAWLRANDWEHVDTRPNFAATYRKSAGAEGDFLVEVPLNRAFGDYARRMGEIIDTLVIASAQPAVAVLAEVSAATSDVIRLRVTGPSIGEGRVAIDLGAQLFSNARELLLAAACAAHAPRQVYRARKPAEALQYLRHVKFTPPEAGSFVLTMHSPVPPALETQSLGGEPADAASAPFERRSTLMLASSIAAAREAAERAGLGGHDNAFRDATAQGLSANLCWALASFVDGEQTTGLDISFAWAGSRRVPKDTPRAVHIGADLAHILGEAARMLRDSANTPDFELEGAVVRLESSKPDQGGVAVIAGLVDDRPRRVRVPMGATDYALAIQAHETARLLRCEGELVRKGRGFELERVRHVELSAEDD